MVYVFQWPRSSERSFWIIQKFVRDGLRKVSSVDVPSELSKRPRLHFRFWCCRHSTTKQKHRMNASYTAILASILIHLHRVCGRRVSPTKGSFHQKLKHSSRSDPLWWRHQPVVHEEWRSSRALSCDAWPNLWHTCLPTLHAISAYGKESNLQPRSENLLSCECPREIEVVEWWKSSAYTPETCLSALTPSSAAAALDLNT